MLLAGLAHQPCAGMQPRGGSRAAPRLVSAAPARLAAPRARSSRRPAVAVEARHRHSKTASSNGKHVEEEVQSFQQLFAPDSKGFGGGKRRRAGAGPEALVHFCIMRKLEFGQGFKLAGSAGALGAWDHTQGPDLAWHEGDRWSVHVSLPQGAHDFKFVLQHRSGHLEWEPGSNRHIVVPKSAAELQVVGHWGSTEDTDVLELQQHPGYRKQLQADLAAERAKQQAMEEEEAAAVAAAPVHADGAEALAGEEWAAQLDADAPANKLLLQVLHGFKQDMLSGLSGVTMTMQEMQAELSEVQQQVASLSAGRPLNAAPSELLFAAAEAHDVIPADMLSLQQEMMNFKEESQELRQEMQELRRDLEAQMAENTAAVQDLEHLVKHVVSTSGEGLPSPADELGAASEGWSPALAASGGGGGGRAVAAAALAASPAPVGEEEDVAAEEVLDAEDRLLLERINHLASDLSAEMQEAVHELELQQQTLLQRTQHIVGGAGSSPRSLGWAGSAGDPAGMGSMLPLAARLLESHDAVAWYNGLMLTVLTSCGLWTDELWDGVREEPLRATWASYKATWTDACVQTWKDSITTRQALMASLSTNTMLAMHVMWSLQELSTRSKPLAGKLTHLGTSIELGLMLKLWQKGGVGRGWSLGVSPVGGAVPVGGGEAAAAAQCAVVLQRWLAASGYKQPAVY